jgi:hypothetical protein
MNQILKKIIFISMGVWLLWSFQSYAYDSDACTPPKPEEAMVEATEIFIGKLLSIRDEDTDIIEYEFEVEKRYKGPAKETVTVYSDNAPFDPWSRFFPNKGDKLLVIAYMKNGLLKTGDCYVRPAKYKLNKYDVPFEEIFDSLALLTIDQIKQLEGYIDAKIIKLGDAEIEKYFDITKSYTIVELNKGKKDGLYKGMEMCFTDFYLDPISVIDVKEKGAKAVLIDELEDWDRAALLGETVKSTTGTCPVLLPEVKETKHSTQDGLFIDSFLRWYFHKSVLKNIPVVIEEQFSFGHLWGDETQESLCVKLEKEAKLKNEKLVEAVNDHCLKNKKESNLDLIGPLSIKHVALTKNQLKKIFKPGLNRNEMWEEFYKIYPDTEGIVTLSRPGFSKDMSIAVIYMWKAYASLGGIGQYYIFEKKDGRWVKSSMSIGSTVLS